MQDWWKATFPKGRQTLTITDASGHPVSIAYGEKGTGKPLVLVHGIGSWSYSWRHCIEPLSQHFRVICFDATIFPERLPNRGMRSLSNLPRELIQIIDLLRLPYLFAPLVRAIVRVERREVLVDWSAVTPEEVYWITYPYIHFPSAVAKLTEELQLAAREIERLQENQPNLISKIQYQVANITFPTLILWSEHDRWFPATDGEKLRSRIPNSMLQILPNCGHDASTGCPEAINSAILAFLRDTGFLDPADVPQSSSSS